MPAGPQPIICGALDAIFQTFFDKRLDARAAWQLVRADTILELVKLSLGELAKSSLSSSQITRFTAFFESQADVLAAGGALDLAGFGVKLREELSRG